MLPIEDGVRARYILIVEDNPGDVQLIQEAFLRVNPFVHFYVANDGARALAILRREGPFADAPRPDLILLDLAMPKMRGHELLALIKQDAKVKAVPTVVLTSSGAPSDIAHSYQLHANSYLQKPMELEGLYQIAQSINDFWLTQSTLPSAAAEFGSL
jgi:two-component system, chemotaxis family, response regulator Rcp1